MEHRKRKAVFTADPRALAEVEALVRKRAYRSASAFLREAIAEKLERIHRRRLAGQVDRYCANGHGDEDRDLIGAQAFDED